jgi:hypothetical protein
VSDDPNASPSPPALLSREERIERAIKILRRYKGQHEAVRSDIESVLDRMPEELGRLKGNRSKFDLPGAKAFAEQYGKALRRVINLTEKAPPGFGVPPLHTNVTVKSLGIDKHRFNVHDTLRDLRVLLWMCEKWEETNLKKEQKPSADDMRIAARAALFLCEKYGINLAITQGGRFCRLAAFLYGDPAVHFRPHCKWARDERNKHLKVSKRTKELGKNNQ